MTFLTYNIKSLRIVGGAYNVFCGVNFLDYRIFKFPFLIMALAFISCNPRNPKCPIYGYSEKVECGGKSLSGPTNTSTMIEPSVKCEKDPAASADTSVCIDKLSGEKCNDVEKSLTKVCKRIDKSKICKCEPANQ